MLFMCILLIFAIGVNPILNPAAIPTHLFLLHSFGIHNIFTLNVPSWSISAEWWAYMIFPLIVLCLYKRKWLTVACCSVFVIGAYLSIMFLLARSVPFNPGVPMPHNLDSTYDYGFLRGLAGFTTGLLLYILYQAHSI